MRLIQDKGRGKSAAINEVLPSLRGEIVMFTDGDVVILPQAVNELVKQFKDPKIGCVAGRVVSANPRTTMLGFWSHLLADAGAHRIRKEASGKGEFVECSGYLFAFRNNLIKAIPTDVAEDTIIPYFIREKGYRIGYAPNARVLVKNPTTISDWIKQRKRTAKSHETLQKYVDTKKIPRVKTFANEVRKGICWALSYPKTMKEYYWTLLLFLARLSMWVQVMYETKVKGKQYADRWERIRSAR